MLEFHDTRISYMPETADWRHSLGHVVHLAQRFRSRFVERQILVQLQLRRYQARRSVFEFARWEALLSNSYLLLPI